MGGHFLLQGILPTQGLNLRLLRGQLGSLLLSHQGSEEYFCCAHLHVFSCIPVFPFLLGISLGIGIGGSRDNCLKKPRGDSPVAPWLSICLTLQGTWVPSLVRELRFPVLWNNYAHVSQILRPCTPAGESALQQSSCVLQLGPDTAKTFLQDLVCSHQ